MLTLSKEIDSSGTMFLQIYATVVYIYCASESMVY